MVLAQSSRPILRDGRRNANLFTLLEADAMEEIELAITFLDYQFTLNDP